MVLLVIVVTALATLAVLGRGMDVFMKRCFCHSMNNRGFSIMGAIVAAGMMGGLALFLVKMTNQQQSEQKKAETRTELSAIHQKILTVLHDGQSCTETLGRGAILADGDRIPKLKNREGEVVLEEGKAYNRLLKVESMKIKKIHGSGAKTRELDIEIIFKRKGKANSGYDKVAKTFSITVELATVTPSMTLARCHHALDAKEQGLKERMCVDMGGEMVSIPGTAITRCSVDNLHRKFCENMGGSYTVAPAMRCNVSPILSKLCISLGGSWNGTACDIASVYANVVGDTMTGNLNTQNISCTSINCPAHNISAKGEVIAQGSVGDGVPSSVQLAAELLARRQKVAKKECTDKGGKLVDASLYSKCADYLPREVARWAAYRGGNRYNIEEVSPAKVRSQQNNLLKGMGKLCCTISKSHCNPGYKGKKHVLSFPQVGDVLFFRCTPSGARDPIGCTKDMADTDLPCTPPDPLPGVPVTP